MRAGTLVEFQGHVTQLTGEIRQIRPTKGGPTNKRRAYGATDDKTASFQWREPSAINPLVAACLKPLNFRGFAASGVGLMGPDPSFILAKKLAPQGRVPAFLLDRDWLTPATSANKNNKSRALQRGFFIFLTNS